MTEMTRSRFSLSPSRLTSLLATCCLALAGCPGADPATPPPVAQPHAGTKLKLAVVDDPGIAAAARQFQGEWKARTGAEFEVLEWSPEQLRKATRLDVDAVIVSAADVGALAAKKLLLPAPAEALASGDLAWSDLFDAVRLREATWGGKTYAVPLGSPTFVCYCRQDLLAKFEKQPPETWEDYQRLAAFFSDAATVKELELRAEAPWSGAIEPLAAGVAGLTLLARAAPAAKHPDFFSALFDIDDMRPLINSPPFVAALTELVASNKATHERHRQLNVDQTRAAFWRGECALALTWPSAVAWDSKQFDAAKAPPLAVVELPGSRKVFNPGSGQWDERGGAVRRVTLVSAAGRSGAVASASQHLAAAWQLVVDLCGPQWGEQLGQSSDAVAMSRQSQLGSPAAWMEPPAKIAAKHYAGVMEAALSRQEVLAALPIPGRERYLAALDNAVQRAVAGDAAPQAALDECAAEWRKITEELGASSQGEAYRGSVVR